MRTRKRTSTKDHSAEFLQAELEALELDPTRYLLQAQAKGSAELSRAIERVRTHFGLHHQASAEVEKTLAKCSEFSVDGVLSWRDKLVGRWTHSGQIPASRRSPTRHTVGKDCTLRRDGRFQLVKTDTATRDYSAEIARGRAQSTISQTWLSGGLSSHGAGAILQELRDRDEANAQAIRDLQQKQGTETNTTEKQGVWFVEPPAQILFIEAGCLVSRLSAFKSDSTLTLDGDAYQFRLSPDEAPTDEVQRAFERLVEKALPARNRRKPPMKKKARKPVRAAKAKAKHKSKQTRKAPRKRKESGRPAALVAEVPSLALRNNVVLSEEQLAAAAKMVAELGKRLDAVKSVFQDIVSTPTRDIGKERS